MINLEDILDDAARYLRGEMDAEERSFFEQLLEQHKTLREELRFMQLVREGLTDLKAEEEKKPDAPVPGASKQARRRLLPYWIAASVVLGLLLSYWIYRKLTLPDSPVIHYAQAVSRGGQKEYTGPSILIEQLGGDGRNSASDRGQSVRWTPSGEIAFAATFEGKGSLGPFEFASAGQRDMLLGKYDIDRGFNWILPIGGAESPDIPQSIAVDRGENLIVTGGFGGKVNFGNRILRATGTDNMGNHDFFVAKYNPAGSLLWTNHGGGIRIDHQQTGVNSGLAVVADHQDNIIVSGVYIGAPVIAGKRLPSGGPNEDLFLVKYTSTGQPMWIKTVTASYMIYGTGLATDPEGNIYLAGSFGHHNLGGQAYFDDSTLTSFGGRDIFLAKYNAEGELQWVRQAGSPISNNGYDQARSVVVDSEGNTVVAGEFVGKAAFGTDTLTSFGGRDIFLAKYGPEGQTQWVSQAGSPQGSGQQNEIALALAIDREDFIVVTGSFTGTARFDSKTLVAPLEQSNFFIARYRPDGQIQWVRQFDVLDGFREAEGRSIDISDNGNVVVTGFFSGTIRIGDQVLNSQGREDIFILVFNEEGTILSAESMIVYL